MVNKTAIDPKELIKNQFQFLHDISGPLMVIMGTTENLLTESENQIFSINDERLIRLQSSIEKLIQIVNVHRTQMKELLLQINQNQSDPSSLNGP